MVIQLVKKDLTYLITSLKSTWIMLICFALGMPMISVGLGCVIPALVCYIGFFNTLAYEERNKANLLNLTLPVDRKDICFAKYIQVLLFIIVFSILSILGLMVKRYTSPLEMAFYSKYFWELIPIMLGTALIYSAIVIPCVFYFGTIKSRYMLLFIYIIIFAGANSVNSIGMEKFIEGIVEVCGSHGGTVGVLVAGGIFILSYFVSLGIWERKEF